MWRQSTDTGGCLRMRDFMNFSFWVWGCRAGNAEGQNSNQKLHERNHAKSTFVQG